MRDHVRDVAYVQRVVAVDTGAEFLELDARPDVREGRAFGEENLGVRDGDGPDCAAELAGLEVGVDEGPHGASLAERRDDAVRRVALRRVSRELRRLRPRRDEPTTMKFPIIANLTRTM